MPGGRNTTGAAVSKTRVRKATGRKARRRGKSLLDLSVVIEQPFLTINGKAYDMLTMQGADLMTLAKVTKLQEDFEALGELDLTNFGEDLGRSQEIQNTLSETLGGVIEVILPTAPATILDRLPMAHQMAIVRAFMSTVPSRAPTATPSPESPQTGENGSQGSTDSTEPETPPSG